MGNTFRCTVAIVIPVHNRKNITVGCLRKLKDIKCGGYEKEVIVVDDGSSDGTAEAIRNNFNSVTVLRGDGNLWWTGAVRLGVEYALKTNHEYVLIMNDDIDFEADFLDVLMNARNEDQNSIVASTTIFSGSTKRIIWKAGMRETRRIHPRFVNVLNNEEWNIKLPELIEVDAVSGRAMLVPAKIFRSIGLFDHSRFPHGGGDHEFCLRAKKNGYRVYVHTRSLIYSEPGKGKSLFHFLRKTSRLEFAKSLRNLRYSWNVKTTFYTTTCHRGIFKGVINFLLEEAIILKWLVFKTVLPGSLLNKILLKRTAGAL